MEDRDNISEEYKLLAGQVYSDYIALGSLEKTAKKHKIPVSLAKRMIEDATGTSQPSLEERKLSIPIGQLKEEYMKCLSLKVLAERYGVGIKAVSWAFRKHGISIIKLHHEVTLNKIHDEYRELVQKLGRHPTHKEINTLDGGKHLYSRIYGQYGSLSNFRKAYGDPRSFISPRKLKEDYLKYGSLKVMAEHYGVSPVAVEGVFKKNSVSLNKLHREILLKKIEDAYVELFHKLGHHPARGEMHMCEDIKDLYHKIRYYYGSLTNFRKACGYHPPIPIKDEIKTRGALRAKEIYKDYVSLGMLKKVARKHGISPERVRQILKEGDSAGLFKYESKRDPANKEKFYSLMTPDKLEEDFRLHGSMRAIAKYYNVSEPIVSQLMQKFNLSLKELRYEHNKIKTHDDYEKLVRTFGHHPTATELIRGIKVMPSLHSRILFYYGSLDNFRKTFGYPPAEKWYAKSVERIKHRAEESRKKILHCIKVKPGIAATEIVDILGIASEAVRLHLIKLESNGIIEKRVNRYRYYYYLKNPEAVSFDDKDLKLSDLKTPLSLEDKAFIDKISRLYIESGDFTIVAKKIKMHKASFLEHLDYILGVRALAPIHSRYEFVLALRIKRIYDQAHSAIRVAKYFRMSEAAIDKYLRYGNKAGLFKRSENLAKRHDPRAIPKKEDPASKKNIALIKTIKEEYDKLGSRGKIARRFGVSKETIRHMLIMGNDLGLFEYPQHKLYERLGREQLQRDFKKYKSIDRLCKYYHTNSRQVKEALSKHNLSLQGLNIEIHRQGILRSYQSLVERLGHHPSTSEIKQESPYLIHGIKKWWGSIFTFRKAYGFPNTKMGRPLHS